MTLTTKTKIKGKEKKYKNPKIYRVAEGPKFARATEVAILGELGRRAV